MSRTFEWGVVIAAFLSVSSLVPRRYARLAYFLHPKLRKIDAVLFTPQPITLILRPAGGSPPGPDSTPTAFPYPNPSPGSISNRQ